MCAPHFPFSASLLPWDFRKPSTFHLDSFHTLHLMTRTAIKNDNYLLSYSFGKYGSSACLLGARNVSGFLRYSREPERTVTVVDLTLQGEETED